MTVLFTVKTKAEIGLVKSIGQEASYSVQFGGLGDRGEVWFRSGNSC